MVSNNSFDGMLTGGTKTERGAYVGKFTIHKDALAIGHSHPSSKSDAAPGYNPDKRNEGDNVVLSSSNAAPKPNYVVSQGVVVVLEKSDGQLRVRLISGSPDKSTIGDIQSHLRVLQQRNDHP